MTEALRRFAAGCARASGAPWFLVANVLVTVGYLAGGALTHWSDAYLLVYTVAISAATWLLAIVIQHSQNADTQALHLKLDAIVVALDGVSNRLVAAEELPEDALARERERLRERVEAPPREES